MDGADKVAFKTDAASITASARRAGQPEHRGGRGTWTYSVDNSLVQYLGKDETWARFETFTVQSVMAPAPP